MELRYILAEEIRVLWENWLDLFQLTRKLLSPSVVSQNDGIELATITNFKDRCKLKLYTTWSPLQRCPKPDEYSFIMRGGLEIQWGEGWSPVTLFNLFTLLCLSIPLIGFTPSHIYVCRDIKRHMSWSFFVLSDARWEVVVRFVDIGGSFNQYFLNFLFILLYACLNYDWTIHW
jgi:hypothetical protein